MPPRVHRARRFLDSVPARPLFSQAAQTTLAAPSRLHRPTVIAHPAKAAKQTRIVYGDGVLSAIGMGIMDSIGRTLAPILAGVLVTLIVDDRKSERWSLLWAFLYVVVSRAICHWYLSPTWWDRLSQVVNYVFPGIACIVAAMVVARLRRHPGTSP
jgi:hypothetical protein